jgi:membrane protease YdiL (CAAX protease family)
MAIDFTPALVQHTIGLTLLVAGLPWLIRGITRIVEQRGVGLPHDGAWNDVCWGRTAGGFEFVIVCMVVHLLVIYGMAGLASLPLGLPQPSDSVAATVVWSLLTCAHWVVVCGLILGWIVWRARGRLDSVGLTRRHLGHSVLTGLNGFPTIMPAVLIVMYAANYIYFLFTTQPMGEHPMVQALHESQDPWMVAAIFAAAGLLIPFFEELFYRGLIQTSLLRTGSPALAIVITSLLFGMAHLASGNAPVNVPAVTVLSLGLGYVYYRTRSLWASVALHAVFNLYNLTLTLTAKPIADHLNSYQG